MPRQLTQPPPPTPPPQQTSIATEDTRNTNAVVVELFRKLHLLTFEDGLDRLEVEDRLAGIERIFDLIDCLDFRKVTCATFMWTYVYMDPIEGNLFEEILLHKYPKSKKG